LQRFSNEEGHGQDYSVLSVLENVANHDCEHAAQIRATLAHAPWKRGREAKRRALWGRGCGLAR
jgi:hypothetical protein